MYLQYFWNFSIYLEALAIIPQLIVLQRYREVENITGHYVFLLGAYRLLYILNWIYRSYNEEYYRHNWVAYGSAVLQTVLYVDFFYYYLKRCVCKPLFGIRSHVFLCVANTAVGSSLCRRKERVENRKRLCALVCVMKYHNGVRRMSLRAVIRRLDR